MFSFLFYWLEHVKLEGRALWERYIQGAELTVQEQMGVILSKKNQAGRKIASLDFEEFSLQHLTRKVEITTFLVFTPD